MITKMIIRASALLCRFQSKKGQSLVEYALILSFISVLSVAVLSILGVQVRAIFLSIISALSAARAGI